MTVPKNVFIYSITLYLSLIRFYKLITERIMNVNITEIFEKCVDAYNRIIGTLTWYYFKNMIYPNVVLIFGGI